MASELQIRTKLTTESRFDKNKIDGLPRIGQYAVEKIREQIIAKKITATGRTQQSLRYSVDGEKELRIIADAGDRAPISTLQYGREPGKMPPINSIKEWIIAKRMTYKKIEYIRLKSLKWQPKYTPEERALNSLAGAIAQKIARDGTKRHRENDLSIYSPILKEVVELFAKFIADKNEKTIINTLIK